VQGRDTSAIYWYLCENLGATAIAWPVIRQVVCRIVFRQIRSGPSAEIGESAPTQLAVCKFSGICPSGASVQRPGRMRSTQPRLVCAEATHASAVVVARLTMKQYIPNASDGADLNVYKLATVTVVRGRIPATFTINEPNDSGRAPFDWKPGEDYLLFLSYVSQQNAWTLDGCGNSGRLRESAGALEEIEGMSHSNLRPLIAGMVSTDSWTTGVSDLPITVSGTDGTFHTRTGRDGRFELRVPPGSYDVTAGADPSSFPPNPFSNEQPEHLKLEDGECGQVEFSTR
jgi:hypothetical protein